MRALAIKNVLSIIGRVWYIISAAARVSVFELIDDDDDDDDDDDETFI